MSCNQPLRKAYPMKINDSLKSILNTGIEKTESASASASSAAQKLAEQPSTSGTTAATKSSQLQALQSAVAANPAFDAGKVDDIKSTIASGSFAVDAAKVADGLIANAVGLIKP